MIKNYFTVCLLALFSALSISHLSAQEVKETKKVIVIEKKVDEDGNVTEKKIVKEGKEAEKHLKEAGENIWISKDGENVKVTEKKAYKMVVLDDDGKEKVIEWNGEGEMPEELKGIMKEHDLEMYMDVEVEVGDEEHKDIKIITKGNGNEEVIELELEGDELPDDVKKMLEEKGINIFMMDGDHEDIKVIVEKEMDKNSNKVQLGVFIEEAEKGAKVTGIMEGSAAEKAGLTEGDVITRVNDTPVTSIESLLGALSGFNPNDIAIIEAHRDGERKAFEVVLQERKDAFEHKSWEKVIELHEEHDHEGEDKEEEIIIIKKKVKVKKDKK
ncbi:MAG: PDZ domain-containing protein [Bacteroidia bacterium]|nr:PDZ domain-containing protein [Bacteroidia bacterium]